MIQLIKKHKRISLALVGLIAATLMLTIFNNVGSFMNEDQLALSRASCADIVEQLTNETTTKKKVEGCEAFLMNAEYQANETVELFLEGVSRYYTWAEVKERLANCPYKDTQLPVKSGGQTTLRTYLVAQCHDPKWPCTVLRDKLYEWSYLDAWLIESSDKNGHYFEIDKDDVEDILDKLFLDFPKITTWGEASAAFTDCGFTVTTVRGNHRIYLPQK